MKFIGLLVLGIFPFVMTSCLSTSSEISARKPNQLAVNKRVNKNSDRYSKLSSSQKQAVSQGRLAKGLPKDAVRIAWGKPGKVTSSGNKENWIYYRLDQVIVDAQAGPAGRFSRHFSSSEKFRDGYAHTDFNTVRREDKTAHFENGRLVSWTQSRR